MCTTVIMVCMIVFPWVQTIYINMVMSLIQVYVVYVVKEVTYTFHSFKYIFSQDSLCKILYHVITSM